MVRLRLHDTDGYSLTDLTGARRAHHYLSIPHAGLCPRDFEQNRRVESQTMIEQRSLTGFIGNLQQSMLLRVPMQRVRFAVRMRRQY